MAERNPHPYGIDPSDQQVDKAVWDVRKIYDECPTTTCCHKAVCCNAGCPNMYYTEFLSIRRGVVDRMTPDERVNLTLECFRRYLYDQKKPKPCVFLKKDNMCSIYSYRHIKCRLYGLIPDEMYNRNADEVAAEMGVEKEKVPLCNQCEFVKMTPLWKEKYPDNKLPESVIADMEMRIKDLDRSVGISKMIQNEGYNFLTYHDWHLMFEFGEQMMVGFTQLRLKWSDEQKEKFIGDLKVVLEDKFKKPVEETPAVPVEPPTEPTKEVSNG